MSLPLIITADAEEDLAEAKAWYERKRKGLAEEFLLCVEAALDQIRRVPAAATEVYPGVRRVVVRRFPYGVFYRADPDQSLCSQFTIASATPEDGNHGPDPRSA